MDTEKIAQQLSEEAEDGAYLGDSFSLFFNKQGFRHFRDKLPHGTDEDIPVYSIDITNIHYRQFVHNLRNLMPLIKGYSLSLTVPQKRRKLVTFLNEQVLGYINHPELDHSASIISELTANAEKSNLEKIIRTYQLDAGTSVAHVLRKRREEIIHRAVDLKKRVQIIWKFSPLIFKVEVKNNTIVPEYALTSIKEKMSAQLNSLADGFVGEVFDRLGAGLGLYFVNFFSDEMKEKYGFETIFRIFTTETSTSATLTVFFEK